MAKDLSIEYVAGIFDGEGCIQLVDTHIEAWVTNVHLPLIIKLQDQFGGYIYSDDRGGNRQVCHKWIIQNTSAIDFIKLIAPFLMIKKAQVDLVELFNKERPGKGIKWDESSLKMYKMLFSAFKKEEIRGISS